MLLVFKLNVALLTKENVSTDLWCTGKISSLCMVFRILYFRSNNILWRVRYTMSWRLLTIHNAEFFYINVVELYNEYTCYTCTV